VPGTDALEDHQRASDDSVVVTPRRVKVRSQESAEQSRKFFKQIVIGVLVVTIGPLLFFTALELSKPYKLKWAADSAAERSEFYTAAHSQLLADMRHDDDNSDRAWKKVKRMGDRAEEAITELGLILEEMTPHGRKAWAESQIDKKMEKFHSR
jgi:hypothetical protein